MSKSDCQYCNRGKLKDCDFINDTIYKNKIKRLEKENKFFREVFDMIQKTSRQARDFMKDKKCIK